MLLDRVQRDRALSIATNVEPHLKERTFEVCIPFFGHFFEIIFRFVKYKCNCYCLTNILGIETNLNVK